jgi:hypothetical protein
MQYIVQIFSFSEIEIEDGEVIKKQKEGWEICGNVWIHPTETWCNAKTIKIPFKRKIK